MTDNSIRLYCGGVPRYTVHDCEGCLRGRRYGIWDNERGDWLEDEFTSSFTYAAQRADDFNHGDAEAKRQETED